MRARGTLWVVPGERCPAETGALGTGLLSVSGTTVLQQPGYAPGLELVPGEGGANVGMGCEDHAAVGTADEPKRLIAQVRQQMQQRAVGEPPVHGEGAVGLELDATRGADLRDERHDVTL